MYICSTQYRWFKIPCAVCMGSVIIQWLWTRLCWWPVLESIAKRRNYHISSPLLVSFHHWEILHCFQGSSLIPAAHVCNESCKTNGCYLQYDSQTIPYLGKFHGEFYVIVVLKYLGWNEVSKIMPLFETAFYILNILHSLWPFLVVTYARMCLWKHSAISLVMKIYITKSTVIFLSFLGPVKNYSGKNQFMFWW